MADKKLKPREQAFIIIFEKSFNPELTVEEIVSNASECESVSLSSKAANMAKGVDSNIEAIDKLIEDNLRGWSKARISKVALAVLRLGVYELKIAEKPAPVGVVISEAVNICKDYGSEEDKSFVNGVLGSVSRS
ncbi:MAG: transcription antitermination factor NusB [Clostridia bacterium]|nr:transcription antitermination factor NusB [Clostridia bacterium]